MVVLDARVNVGVGVELLLEDVPSARETRFQFFSDGGTNPEAGYYYAEKDGIVRAYYWSGQEDRGFGGHCFPITLESGEKRKLLGPWDCGSAPFHRLGVKGFVRAYWPHLPAEPLDVVWKRGWTFCAGYATARLVDQVLRIYAPEWRLLKRPLYSGIGDKFYLNDAQRQVLVDGSVRPPDTYIYVLTQEVGLYELQD